MIARDQFRYSLSHLGKARLRTILTAAGVSIGIGAMTSMVSVGTGTQRNVMRAFNEENILTAVTVYPDSGAGLDAGVVDELRRLPGVRDAWPQITLPGLLVFAGERSLRTLEGLPARVVTAQIADGRVELLSGRAYGEGEEGVIMLSRRAAEGLLPAGVPVDTLVGERVTFIVAQAPGGERGVPAPEGETGGEPGGAGRPATRSDDLLSGLQLPGGLELPSGLESLPLAGMLRGLTGRFISSVTLECEIVGIVEGRTTLTDMLGVSIWVPPTVVEPLYARAFRSLETVLTGETYGDSYTSAQVLAQDVLEVRPLQDRLRKMGLRGTSILDQISEIRTGFVILNGFLAVLGGVSLFVAAMMIVNTLVMAVLERTGEIGLLKSLGASNLDVMRLFLTEAAVIGLLGGFGGLVLGRVVAEITNIFANMQFQRAGEVHVDLVAFPLWLVLGGLAFAVGVSLAAGWYPARRAARVDPVVALRHY